MDRSPNADEAAAIAAAVEQFVAETAPGAAADGEVVSPWQRAALAEGVGARGTVQKHREGGETWLS
jgi:hypothetical protein